MTMASETIIINMSEFAHVSNISTNHHFEHIKIKRFKILKSITVTSDMTKSVIGKMFKIIF